ncbi:uncharacterized protein LOC142357372, partial [Convolutriloba macropyga]|uniref:uncharacterized protein LOC142357372 n=1 Tax=Convolutriloba macropyga TaxID=536237 RepID=UPI003F51BCB9
MAALVGRLWSLCWSPCYIPYGNREALPGADPPVDMLGRGFGDLAGPPTDFGSDLQRAQAFLTKYKPRQGSTGPSSRSSSGPKPAGGRGAKRPSKGQSTPSTISSLSDSSDNGDISIEFGDDEEARDRAAARPGIPSKQAAGRTTPGASQQKKTVAGQRGAAADKSQTTAALKSNLSSDISVSFSEDEMSSGSIEVGVSQTRKGASSKTASKPAPQKSTSKPGNTKKKQNAKQRMAEQLSMSSDLSLSGSIELDDDDPPPRAPGKSRQPGSDTTKSRSRKLKNFAVLAFRVQAGVRWPFKCSSGPTNPCSMPATVRQTSSKHQPVEVEDISSGDIVFSSSGDISSVSEISDVGPKHRAAARQRGSRANPRGSPSPRQAKKSKEVSIEFSEDDEEGDISFEDLEDVTSKAKSSQGWQPPGAASKNAGSSKPASLSKRPSAGNAGKKISVAVSDDFSITMTESEMSKDLEDAAAATESLYAQLTAVGGGKADGGSASSSISITDSSGASGEKEPVSSLLASDLGEAAAATEALYNSLQPATIMRQDSSSSSEPESPYNSKLASDLDDAAAATDALFESLQAAPVKGESGSSEDQEDSQAELEGAMDATEELYRMLGHVKDGSSPDGSSSLDGDRTLPYEPTLPELPPDVSASLQDAADATDALYEMLVP